MTNPTTNEQIARARGYVKSACHREDDSGYAMGRETIKIELWWSPPPNEHALPVPLPDFEHTWEHAGPLLEEMYEADMLENGSPGRLSDGKDTLPGWYVPWHCNETSQEYESTGDTLTIAICHAWLGWKKQ